MEGIRRGEDGSQLFLLRLWLDASDPGAAPGEAVVWDGSQPRWRGRVQHVTSGRAESFDGWMALLNMLVEMMPNEPAGEPGVEQTDARAVIREE